MNSFCTPAFWKQYGKLSQTIQREANQAYAQWQADPSASGLNFEKLQGFKNRWSARVGIHHRAVCEKDGEDYIWFWIGTKEEFLKLK